MKPTSSAGEGRMSNHFVHLTFFRLADTSDELVRRFLDACKKHLASHDGMIHFSVGSRALAIRRDVSALDFDIAMHMIFRDFESFQAYAASDRHQEFITETAGMSTGRIVYDSFVEPSDCEPPCR